MSTDKNQNFKVGEVGKIVTDPKSSQMQIRHSEEKMGHDSMRGLEIVNQSSHTHKNIERLGGEFISSEAVDSGDSGMSKKMC